MYSSLPGFHTDFVQRAVKMRPYPQDKLSLHRGVPDKSEQIPVQSLIRQQQRLVFSFLILSSFPKSFICWFTCCKNYEFLGSLHSYEYERGIKFPCSQKLNPGFGY